MRRFLVLLFTPVLLLAPALPAQAATVSVSDPAGDAPARFDVVQVVVSNTSEAVSTQVTFTDLRKAGEVLEFYFGDSANPELSYGVDVWRQHGKLHVQVLKDDENGTQPHPCKKATAHWNQTSNIVHTSVPTSCMQGVSFTPLDLLMRTSRPHAEAEKDGLPDITVDRD
jgi:hypothetical protein